MCSLINQFCTFFSSRFTDNDHNRNVRPLQGRQLKKKKQMTNEISPPPSVSGASLAPYTQNGLIGVGTRAIARHDGALSPIPT